MFVSYDALNSFLNIHRILLKKKVHALNVLEVVIFSARAKHILSASHFFLLSAFSSLESLRIVHVVTVVSMCTFCSECCCRHRFCAWYQQIIFFRGPFPVFLSTPNSYTFFSFNHALGTNVYAIKITDHNWYEFFLYKEVQT